MIFILLSALLNAVWLWDNGTHSIKGKSFYFLKSSEIWDNGTHFVKGKEINEMNTQLVWNSLTHLIEMHIVYTFVCPVKCCLALGQWDTFYQSQELLFPEKFGSLGQWDTLCQSPGYK